MPLGRNNQTRFLLDFPNFFVFLQISDSTKPHGGALLQGSYDEQESAQSFAEALMAWRNSGKEEKMWSNPTDTKSMCE